MNKVLMFIDTIGRNGGAERQFAGLACMLAEKGYPVKVIAYYPDKGFYDIMTENGVDVEICDFGKSRLSKIFNAYKAFRKVKPDVVISYKNGPNFIACALKWLGMKFKLIVSDRNTLQGTSKSINLQYKLYQKADFVVPNSNSQARFINRFYPSLNDKVKVITNFTDTEVFHPSVQRRSNATRQILVCGRITEQKNLHNFLQAVALLKHRLGCKLFAIKWYGVKDKPYFDQCQDLIKRLDIGDVFSFQEPRKDIDEIYRQADIFVLPSIYEGFPNVLCEAMASGLPVTASNVCDNPDIVTVGKEGVLFNPLDIEDMAAKIEGMISLPEAKLLEMGKCGRETIVKLCSKEAFCDSYCALISNE